ncbi:MAG: oxidoreductase [Acidobacteriota bacterium]
MSGKPKVAFYWCASCGGCEEAVVDLAEDILGVTQAVDIVFWPVALDFKRHDVESLPDEAILASFINGAIRSTEQEEMAHMLRAKSQLVVAFGACAQLGGVPGLANLWDRPKILQAVYWDSPSTANSGRTIPKEHHAEDGHSLHLPVLFDSVKTLDQTVAVDYYLPGCPPTPRIIREAVGTLLSGSLPPKGTVLAPDRALCDECPRKPTRPDSLGLQEWKRPHQVLIDPEKCLLAQGLVCLGPATRAGCEALCPAGNMPCTGCFGPTSRVRDYGGKALSAIASVVESNDETEIARILDTLPDPVGTFYRYSLPASCLQRKQSEVTGHGK